MSIKPILLTAVQGALNNYLQMASNKDQLLAPLAGTIIAVTVEPFGETFYLCPSANSIPLLDQCPDPPDTHITGTLWALGLMGVSSKPMRSVFSGEIKIEGDVHIGHKLQQLFEKLDIDLEKRLALFTGEWFAGQVGELFRAGQSWSKESLETFRLNLAEYLQEETRDLPAKPEADLFYRQVDEIRTAYDRLHSRVERLHRHLTTSRENTSQS
jgi:ubiquinone biosynthesis protein UbiJ